MSTRPSRKPRPRHLPYAVVDVFAEKPLEGNALAIFTDARGLSTNEMQRIARETNLSETTFIFPRTPQIEQQRGVWVRIFTTEEELPFAGHPTLGTASWIQGNNSRSRGKQTIHLELQGGRIPVTFPERVSGEIGVFGTMRQNDPIFGNVHAPAPIAVALNLAREDLDPSAPIQTVSTGIPFCIVPLRSMEVAARLQIPQQAARHFLEKIGAKFFYCITRTPRNSRADWHARMQFYNGEDPATGSASGCAISWLVKYNLVESGEPVLMEQGIEMLRPSLIHLKATLAGRIVTDVFVGGRTIPVASGRLFLP